MTLMEALRARLLADTDITGLVGASGVYAMRADQQSTYPLIILQQISRVNETHSLGELGLGPTRMQITCWAHSYKVAHDLAELVRLSISGYRGLMGYAAASEGDPGTPGVQVQDCKLENELDTDEDSPGMDGRRLYGAQFDYIIWYEFPVPVFTED